MIKWKLRAVKSLKLNDKNPRTIKDPKFEELVKSIQNFPKMLEIRPIVVNADSVVIGGNMRLRACLKAGIKEVPVIEAKDLTEAEQREFIIKDNVGFGEWDFPAIEANWPEAGDWGLDISFQEMSFPDSNDSKKNLAEMFIIPPFSVFDTRQGYWQTRKRHWLGLGIKSEIGRGAEILMSAKEITTENLNYYRNRKVNGKALGECLPVSIGEAYGRKVQGTSIFDPVLAEICCSWFCPQGGVIIDPFAGGSVRGIVAAFLGFKYFGVDLSKEQIEANREQAAIILEDKQHPAWFIGDSIEIKEICSGLDADFIFSCPPYHDLEVYSDNTADISTLSYKDFCEKYQEIIIKSMSLLKEDRFACFVVGDIRDREGFYKNFVSDTIDFFQAAGSKLYNEIVLINVAGSLPIRAGRQFNSSRKVGKMHQNVLVFYKGDPKKIKASFPNLDFSIVEQEQDNSVTLL